MNVYQKLTNGEYKPKIFYADGPEEFRKETQILERQFQNDLADEFGVVDNPKADLLYSKAYERGHAYSLNEVYIHYADLVELIK